MEGWPTWKRSWPEDPKINFLQDLGHVLKWRDDHAAGKEVWLTEFGYDASTKPSPPSGDFAKWIGSSEREQALWIVRGFLVLAASGVDRAYLFFFNDNDEPHVHGSSGLTRNYQPKPSFYAMAHLHRSLDAYRFARALKQDPEGDYLYEFRQPDDAQKTVLVAWRPHAGSAKSKIPLGGRRLIKAEATPLTAGEVTPATLLSDGVDAVEVELSEAPTFIWLES